MSRRVGAAESTVTVVLLALSHSDARVRFHGLVRLDHLVG